MFEKDLRDATATAEGAGIQAFCPACWAIIPFELATCRVCGADLASLAARDYEAKLLAALRHPMTQVRERAALLLGAVGGLEVFDTLLACAEDEVDSWRAASALRGLDALLKRFPKVPAVDWKLFTDPERTLAVRFAAQEILAESRRHAAAGREPDESRDMADAPAATKS